MSFQTYNAMVAIAAPAPLFRPLDPLLAMAGIIAYGSRLRHVPDDAMAFLRHADGLLRGTEGGGGADFRVPAFRERVPSRRAAS